MQRFLQLLIACLLFAGAAVPAGSRAAPGAVPVQEDVPLPTPAAGSLGASRIYLPVSIRGPQPGNPGPMDAGELRVNVPYFRDGVSFTQTAVFWFGKVASTTNYADVRIGYAPQELWVRLSVFDRYLWYDGSPEEGSLKEWDAASLYLHKDEDASQSLDKKSYRFTSQLSHWEKRSGFSAAYTGEQGRWQTSDLPFTTKVEWRGNAPNDDKNDSGWTVLFRIPFSSLGMAEAPAQGVEWRLGVAVHDRDSAEGPAREDQVWPPALQPDQPDSWGRMAFGLLRFSQPQVAARQTIEIRDHLNGAVVPDAAVGGGTICGTGLDFWSEWGEHSDPFADQVNVQNQYDVADWPCFSKYYVTFPLEAIPPGKVVISSTLTLNQFGNSGGGEWGEPPDSIIQVLEAASDWDEEALTWNNAPLARQNISQAMVEALPEYPGWRGVPRQWDVSGAAARAYSEGQPLRLILYSADGDYHSGKYFWTSDIQEDNAISRPRLRILWGDP